MSNQTETGCCPRFNPEPWQEKEVTWQDKLFIKDHITSFLHIPLNITRVIKKNMEKIEKSGASFQDIMMFDENSLWGADVYLAVDREIPEAKMEKISGSFLTKVYEGPFSDAGKWAKDMDTYVKAQNKESKKFYHWYTTCPKCAKFYGKNYTVMLAKV